MASHHHDLFKALSAIEWDKVTAANLESFLDGTFADAAALVESIPSCASVSAASSPSPKAGSVAGRARSQTDPTLRDADLLAGPHTQQPPEQLQEQLPRVRAPSAESAARARELRKEWREVRVGAPGSRENPLGIGVFKLAARDGRGSWFARRSVHDDLSFERWKLGLEHEFPETMRIQSQPGAGAGAAPIRGIGAERIVERHVVKKVGRAEVFQLSAQFPGPTSPRDFITLLLSSDATSDSHAETSLGKPLREFIVVSKPCAHPDCPPRSGFIRGRYESVEVVREIPVARPAVKRSRSSVDITRAEEGDQPALAQPGGTRAHPYRSMTTENLGKEAVTRAARNQAAALGDISDEDTRSDTGLQLDSTPTAIEWIMITRSDPGGSVPRFMIDKGTPGAIVSDAAKFVKWLTSKAAEDLRPSLSLDLDHEAAAATAAAVGELDKATATATAAVAAASASASASASTATPETQPVEQDYSDTFSSANSQHVLPSSNGLYGMIASAIGAAGSAVSGRLPLTFTVPYRSSVTADDDPNGDEEETVAVAGHDIDRGRGPKGADDDDDDGTSTVSDAASTSSFASAVESNQSGADPARTLGLELGGGMPTTLSLTSTRSDSSTANALAGADSKVPAQDKDAKEMRKLEGKRLKIQDRIRRTEEHMASRREEDRAKDEAALERLRQKHDREIARQQERYQRGMRRLEEKREAERRKAEERQRKATEREDRNRLTMEVDRLTTERDLARREATLLRERVGELQRENTMLVAQLGRAGIQPVLGSSLSVPSASVGGGSKGSNSEVDLAENNQQQGQQGQSGQQQQQHRHHRRTKSERKEKAALAGPK